MKSFRKLLYLPHILNPREWRVILIIIFFTLASGVTIGFRLYTRLTVEAPAVGGVYREGLLREPRTINPLFAAANDTDRDIARLVYSRLITYSGDGNLEFDLAESIDIEDDGKTYIVRLRPGALWHDGTSVSADDVVFTVHAVQDPQYQSPFRANWQGVAIEKVDDLKVRFVLRAPYAPFIENLSLGVLPRHLWQNIPPRQVILHELNLKPVGSGPYKYSSYEQDKDGIIHSYTLIRNGDYYRAGPFLKSIEFHFYSSENDIVIAWEKHLIDAMSPSTAALGSLSGIKNIAFESFTMPRIFGLFINQKRAPALQDIDVRKAVAHAIDRGAIARSIEASGVQPAESLLPPTVPGYTDEIVRYEFDPEKSAELLLRAGWNDTDNDGIREKITKDKNKISTTSLQISIITSDWPDLVRVGETVQDQLRAVGIGVELHVKPFSELESSFIRSREFDLLLFGQVYGYEPDPFAFWHSSQIKDPGLNITAYTSRDADKLLEEARRSPDELERIQKHIEFQQVASRDLPAIFLYTQSYHYSQRINVHRPTIRSVTLPADRFNEIERWYIKTTRVLRDDVSRISIPALW